MVSAKSSGSISVIIVNWNQRELLNDCLCSLSRQSYSDYETIVVDNGSRDNSVALIKEHFPSVKVVELAENKGFTGGNAAGLSVADGEFIALINNDARAEQNWLERLVAPMLTEPDVGICASKIVIDGTEAIDSAGSGLTTAGVGFNRGLGMDRGLFASPEAIFGACGAAALYRRSMLEEIGFLDDTFFLYDEDSDLSFRAQLAGWKCRYVPDAVAHHKGNATSERLSGLHVYYHTRNLEFVWIKNMPAALMVRFFHHKLIQELAAFIYLCLRHGKWASYFHAKIDALKMLPGMWRKRRVIQARRRVSNAYIRSLMTSMFTWGFVRQKIWQFING